jgi:hypothetical protein
LVKTEEDLRILQVRFNNEIVLKNARIQELEEEKRKLQDEFEKLFDDRISLERELEVYRNLLELEEVRFNFLRNSPVHSVTLTARNHYSISSGNNIVIAQHGEDYISIFNVSNQVFFLFYLKIFSSFNFNCFYFL